MPTIMNAANEVAVFSFLDGKSGYLDIERTVFSVCEKMAGKVSGGKELTIDTILDTDKEARRMAGEIIGR